MGKVAVVYHTKYGTTEKYANWIAEETGADLFIEGKCKAKELEDYQVIVYGGAIHAGGILGIKFLQKNMELFEGKKVLAFAVGLNVEDEENRNQCREINFVKNIKDVPCYFCRGGYDPLKVKGFDKKMMGIIGKMIAKKTEEEMTSEERDLCKALDSGVDFTSKEYIKPLVDKINSLDE